MKRKVVCFAVLFVLLTSLPVLAQESTPKSEQHKTAAKKPAPPWKLIKKVPRIDKEAEFAIVRMNDAEYKKFQQSPKDWIDDHHIFSAKVKRMKPPAMVAPEKDPPPEETYWYVILAHWPGSTCSYITYPAAEPS